MVNKESTGPSLALFGILSALYILWAVVGSWYQHYFELSLSPTAWATVLEGVFSPLAFLWLLYAALSQRAELELQRKELQQNNETQAQQQRQMQRQADALEAQIQKLDAQSDAKFEPVIVLFKQDEDDPSVLLTLRNVGSPVISVEAISGGELVANSARDLMDFRKIRGNVLPYWNSQGFAVIRIPRPLEDDANPEFSIGCMRLDAEPILHAYTWVQAEGRIQLTDRRSLLTRTQRLAKAELKKWGQ
jgi:hypothetical protein